MRKVFILLGAIILVSSTKTLLSQANKSEGASKTYMSILGNNGYTSGKVSWTIVDSLLQLKVAVKDPQSGKIYPAVGFSFYYAERGLYEDSTGKPKILTEYYTLNLEGDSIPRFLNRGYQSKAKRGDTIKFYNILAKADSVIIKGENINLILQ